MHMTSGVLMHLVCLSLFVKSAVADKCSMDSWTEDPTGKYLRFETAPTDWKKAKENCESLGGQLVIVRETETDILVNKIIDDADACDFKVRIGLYSDENGVMRWVDGTKVENEITKKAKTKNKCYVKNQCASWTPESCDNGRFSICETIDPCNTIPSLKTKEHSKPMVNETFTVDVNGQRNIEMTCFVQRLSNQVKEVALRCGGEEAKEVTGTTSVVKSILMTLRMVGQICVCISRSKNGVMHSAYVTLNVRSAPTLRDDPDKIFNSSKIITEGDQIALNFTIFLKPMDLWHELSRNEEILPEDRYNISSRAADAPFSLSVNMILTDLRTNESGTYNLAMANGVGLALHYYFNLTVLPIKGKEKSQSSGTLMVVVVVVGGLFLLAAVCAVVLLKKAKQGANDDNLQSLADDPVDVDDDKENLETEELPQEENQEELETEELPQEENQEKESERGGNSEHGSVDA